MPLLYPSTSSLTQGLTEKVAIHSWPIGAGWMPVRWSRPITKSQLVNHDHKQNMYAHVGQDQHVGRLQKGLTSAHESPEPPPPPSFEDARAIVSIIALGGLGEYMFVQIGTISMPTTGFSGNAHVFKMCCLKNIGKYDFVGPWWPTWCSNFWHCKPQPNIPAKRLATACCMTDSHHRCLRTERAEFCIDITLQLGPRNDQIENMFNYVEHYTPRFRQPLTSVIVCAGWFQRLSSVSRAFQQIMLQLSGLSSSSISSMNTDYKGEGHSGRCNWLVDMFWFHGKIGKLFLRHFFQYTWVSKVICFVFPPSYGYISLVFAETFTNYSNLTCKWQIGEANAISEHFPTQQLTHWFLRTTCMQQIPWNILQVKPSVLILE